MNFSALIDFNKYTLAVAAAGFAYSLESLSPMPTVGGRVLLLVLVLILLLSSLLGVAVFAAATAAHHATGNRKERIEKHVRTLGTAHAVTLCVGMLVLGGMVVDRILTPPPEAATCCEACPD